ncbi:hypothetical protein [Streptomyces sp. NPDC090026]|uniref:hypothetical protein n=1 Tax=Streptomyces sp. NPDC090026 TaxID=3365923 RepID=UPI0037F48E78
MAHDEGSGMVPQPAQPGPREAATEFASRLRALREQTGIGPENFAALLGTAPAEVLSYEQEEGPRVPSMAYVDALLHQVGQRTDVLPDVLADTRRAYGHLLRLMNDDVQGESTAHLYRQMLSVYQLTTKLEQTSAERNAARDQLRPLQEELRHLREVPEPSEEEQSRIQELECATEALEQQSADLGRRRAEILAELDALRSQAGPPGAETLPAPYQAPPVPPPAQLPSAGGGAPPGRRRSLLLPLGLLGGVVILLLGGFAIYQVTTPAASTADGKSTESTNAAPTKVGATTSATPDDPEPTATEESPTPTPDGSASNPTEPEPTESVPSGSTAPEPPSDPGYITTWNDAYSVTGGGYFNDLGNPRQCGGRCDVWITDNSGVDPFISPGDGRSLGLIEPDADIPGPVACQDAAKSQVIQRKVLKEGQRYCLTDNTAVVYFEVVNFSRSGDMSGFLIRWHPE